jgi:uncharacterized membrane protein (UPF0127 family)
MIARTPFLIFILFLFLFAPLSAASADTPGDMIFGHSDVTIVTAAGARYHFSVEVAETPEQLERGLMFRDAMPDDAGMLFLLGTEETASFWMRNTFLPLDMIFIARDGHIINIHRNAPPGSTAIISSTAPVISVLEINAGIAARLGIHAGDHVIHPAFQ